LEGTNSYALLQLFADGGAMMYALVLCSLLALGVIIAKAYTLWAANRRSDELLGRVETLGREGKIDEAVRLAEETPGPVSAIVLAGLRRRDINTSRDIEKAIATTGAIELGFLERGLVLLATIANVAPLLGFLGTVAGMITAFGAIAEAGQVEASLVAGGIKVALITTAAGLLIAIPVNLAYNWFVTRIDKAIVDMEKGTASVLKILWDHAGPVPGSVGGGAAAAALPLGGVATSIEDTRPAQPGPGLADRPSSSGPDDVRKPE
jgi:biopolymer transport protein ExbB